MWRVIVTGMNMMLRQDVGEVLNPRPSARARPARAARTKMSEHRARPCYGYALTPGLAVVLDQRPQAQALNMWWYGYALTLGLAVLLDQRPQA